MKLFKAKQCRPNGRKVEAKELSNGWGFLGRELEAFDGRMIEAFRGGVEAF